MKTLSSPTPAAEFWSRHIHRQSQTSLSVREYCLQHDLGLASFYAWRRKLELACERSTTPAPEFHELRLMPVAAPACLELHLPSGLRVTVPENFSDQTLRRLLEVLSC